MKKIPWTAITIALNVVMAVVAYKNQPNTIKEEVAKALTDKK